MNNENLLAGSRLSKLYEYRFKNIFRNTVSFTEPYHFIISDNFLTPELSEEILEFNELYEKDPNKKMGVHGSGSIGWHAGSAQVSRYLGRKSFFESFLDYLNTKNNYATNELFNMLNLEDEEVVWKSYLYSFRPGYDYAQHPDSTDKVISIVVYLLPMVPNEYISYNLGTKLWKTKSEKPENNKRWRSSDTEYYGDVAYKFNRAFIFSQKSSTDEYGPRSWHSYGVPEYLTSPRLTLLMNAFVNDDKK